MMQSYHMFGEMQFHRTERTTKAKIVENPWKLAIIAVSSSFLAAQKEFEKPWKTTHFHNPFSLHTLMHTFCSILSIRLLQSLIDMLHRTQTMFEMKISAKSVFYFFFSSTKPTLCLWFLAVCCVFSFFSLLCC